MNAAALAMSEDKSTIKGESRGRILIVDDEEVIAGTLKEFLQGESYEVVAATNTPEALRLVESFEPDVVLCGHSASRR